MQSPPLHAKPAAAAPVPAAARDSSADGAVSDEALIGRIVAGDQLAMQTLFARPRIPLYRWLLRLVRDETTAEDLLSDVFLDVWRSSRVVQRGALAFPRGCLRSP